MSIFRFEALRTSRVVFGLTVVMVAIMAAPACAAAKRHKHVAYHHHRHVRVQMAQAAAPQAVTLGPMRYYGGPKSPMWREAR